MASQLNLQADEPGVFPGLAAHFSGDGFSDMNFAMQAVSPAEFAAWSTATSTSGPELDDASYRALLQQTENVKPYTYRAVQAGLFDAILQQKLPPGDGPQTGRPNASASPATTASEK
jgi:cytochrome o ubiquinol oxidase subunit 2